MRYIFYERDRAGDRVIGSATFEPDFYDASTERVKKIISNTMTLEGEQFDPRNMNHVEQLRAIYSGSFLWVEPAVVNESNVLLYLKQKEEEIFDRERKIIGNPIPKQEVERGARTTKNTIKDEIERWKKHPILAKYVPTDEELEALLAKQ